MTQDDRIIAYLKAGSSLTGLEALELFGTMKLATRVSELKRQGFDIRSVRIHTNGKSFCEYRLYKPQPQADIFLSPDAAKQHEWSKD
jgi:hypothetical protein